MQDSITHYESAYGEPALREVICFSLKRDFGVERKPENVLITTGYSGGIADGGKKTRGALSDGALD